MAGIRWDEVPSMISMDMKLEKKVFDSFISILTMLEHTPNDQEVNVTLSLGELRQHVQWCQYAAKAADGADATNYLRLKLEAKVKSLDRQLIEYRQQEQLLKLIDGHISNLKGSLTRFKNSREALRDEVRDNG